MNLLPYIFQNGCVTLPIEIIRAFNGHSVLPVYECNETDVRTPYRRVPPSTTQPENLSFDAWRLAHAVKKADCVRWPSSRILWPGAFGFLLENVHIFDWNPAEFRLGSGMSDFYADFSRTSLSGRIGQGMALLFLEDRRYSYIGRFSTLYKTRGKLKKSPDFVVENDRKEWALAEAKGRFVPPEKSSLVKEALKRALDQLDGWNKYFSPQLHNGFAISTFLRETRDPHKESSRVAFVETKPGKPQDPVDFLPDTIRWFPPDAIRRANYASWLSLMGFDDTARFLRAGEERPDWRTRPVPLFALGERQYVVSITAIRPVYRHRAHDPDFLRLILESRGWRLDLWDGSVIIEIVGLDLRVVKAIETTLWQPESQALMEVEPWERRDIPGEFDSEEFHGSVFSDGSLFGEIKIPDMDWPGIESTEVTL